MSEATREQLNKKPTFVIKIQCQQNASWQGTIRWLEGSKEKSFRSALEMLKLMDDIVVDEEEVGW